MQSGDRPILSLKVSRPTCVLAHKHECTWLRLLGHSNKDVPADCLAPNACKHENQNARDPGYTRTASGKHRRRNEMCKHDSQIARKHAGRKIGMAGSQGAVRASTKAREAASVLACLRAKVDTRKHASTTHAEKGRAGSPRIPYVLRQHENVKARNHEYVLACFQLAE
jgi:hypothetical protein